MEEDNQPANQYEEIKRKDEQRPRCRNPLGQTHFLSESQTRKSRYRFRLTVGATAGRVRDGNLSLQTRLCSRRTIQALGAAGLSPILWRLLNNDDVIDRQPKETTISKTNKANLNNSCASHVKYLQLTITVVSIQASKPSVFHLWARLIDHWCNSTVDAGQASYQAMAVVAW
jgi:hypothetical protein